jgi:cytoskeletal protein CcmA (bactofilin family)
MKSKARGDLNGFLDAGSHIHGELHFEDTFRIDGKLTGKAVSKGELVVGERGTVDAEVEVGSVFISGELRGSIKARHRIEIAAGGRAFADLETPVLVVEDGALLEGRCRMTREDELGRSEREGVVRPIPMAKDRSS